VDYVNSIDGQPKTLCEAKSPSIMKKVGSSLPPYGIKLRWGQHYRPLVPSILTKVSVVLFPLLHNICLKKICGGCIVPGLATDGVAVSHLPQLLDCVPPCEG
jgi:hypothetical protein